MYKPATHSLVPDEGDGSGLVSLSRVGVACCAADGVDADVVDCDGGTVARGEAGAAEGGVVTFLVVEVADERVPSPPVSSSLPRPATP